MESFDEDIHTVPGSVLSQAGECGVLKTSQCLLYQGGHVLERGLEDRSVGQLERHVEAELRAAARRLEARVQDLVHQVEGLEPGVVGWVEPAELVVLLLVHEEVVHDGGHPDVEGEGGLVAAGAQDPDLVRGTHRLARGAAVGVVLAEEVEERPDLFCICIFIIWKYN